MNDQPSPPATDHVEASSLLRGDLTNAETLRAADHLERCGACRSELVTSAVGHSLLTATRRTLTPAGRPVPAPAVPPAPTPPARLRRRWALALAATAAAAAVTVGAVVVTGVGSEGPPDDPGRTPPLLATLQPVEGAGSGRVEMVDGDGTVTMTVRTSALPETRAGEYYQVWLFDPRTNKMLALGVLGPTGTAGFELPPRILRRYRAVDVSLERDDGDPSHSVTSVLQGTYDQRAV